MPRFVLCEKHSDGEILCVVPSDAKTPQFSPFIIHAAKFSSTDEALAFRGQMPRQPGGTEQYRVHEIDSNGNLMELNL
jgi:hypothetical protein